MNRFSGNPYAGGAGLADGKLASDLEELVDTMNHDQNGIIQGGVLTAATHTQAGGTGATTWTADIAALDVLVDGVYKHESAQSGFAIHGSTQLVADGQAVYAMLVEKNDGGTLSTVAVKGTPATIGMETVPTDAEIQTALGDGVSFVKLGTMHVSRASTTLTETINMSYRQPHGCGSMRGF